jgi:hypothetical protein
MSFGSAPKPKEPPPPPKKSDGMDEATLFRRRTTATSGVAANFLGGGAGEPGSVGKLGLTGAG